MMSKNWEIHSLTFKKHRTFSEVCKDMIADTMMLYFMLRHTGYTRNTKINGSQCSCSWSLHDT